MLAEVCEAWEGILLSACHFFVDVLCWADSPEAELLLWPPLRAAGRSALEQTGVGAQLCYLLAV